MPRSRAPDTWPSGLEDDLLLQQANAGDQQAFARLVERHGPWLLRRIGRFVHDDDLAQDILQQVWLQLYRSLSSLRVQGTLPAWLARVAHNRCVDELRRKRLLTFSELAIGAEEDEGLPLALVLDPAPPLEEQVEWQELRESLQIAMRALPERGRAVMQLRLEAQLSYSEIEQVLGIPVSTAKSAFFRAKRRLCASCQLDGG